VRPALLLVLVVVATMLIAIGRSAAWIARRLP
jgi:hypothetical protein